MTDQVPPASPPPGYAPVPPPGYELKKKKPFYKRVWFWLLVGVVVIIVIIIAAVASAANNAVNKAHTVVYTVTSNAKTAESVTYLSINGDGTSGQQQANNVRLPWTKTVSGKGDFSSFSLTAQGAQTATRISCQIKIDGAVKTTQNSTGQFAVVSCTASP